MRSNRVAMKGVGVPGGRLDLQRLASQAGFHVWPEQEWDGRLRLVGRASLTPPA